MWNDLVNASVHKQKALAVNTAKNEVVEKEVSFLRDAIVDLEIKPYGSAIECKFRVESTPVVLVKKRTPLGKGVRQAVRWLCYVDGKIVSKKGHKVVEHALELGLDSYKRSLRARLSKCSKVTRLVNNRS